MIDKFTFEAPLGLLGRIAEKTFLRAYMADFLKKRNEAIKSIAEGEQWRHFV
ncbi:MULTISPECIES: hypothetical protein [unclassified Sphingobacterium]|nr:MULTISPECIES: hypothetical protein [unclassified Sphingobacterium]